VTPQPIEGSGDQQWRGEAAVAPPRPRAVWVGLEGAGLRAVLPSEEDATQGEADRRKKKAFGGTGRVLGRPF
jgi:hypothetical protein